MKEHELDSTQKVETKNDKGPKKKFLERRSSWFILGFVLVLLIILIGVLLGIPKGINDRVSLAESQASPKIQSQLESARLDIEEERYQLALERLDWILEEMSPYMSEEELAEVGVLYSQTLLNLSTSGSPTAMPSPTPTILVNTPTPDLRGEEELFTLAQEHIATESWDDVIRTLEALRQKNLVYKSVQVDGMLYVALRNRGVQKILVEGSLEPGIYDLTLAERFAPLDSTAEGIRTWTRLYLTGASFWGVDWSQVVFFFEQVYAQLPNLRDGTNLTATERFRIGAIEYALQLAASGQFCEAQEYFDKAMSISSDPEVQPTAQWVAEECFELENPPTPVPELTPTPTPTPSEEVPTEEPTPAPTLVPTEEPPPEPTEE
jgi:tetratricopeptide (TPR) repeat protein